MRPFIMPETAPDVVGPTTIETVTLAGHVLRFARPTRPEQLLDREEVAQAYEKDQYLPYWAALWPVAKHLGREILAAPWKKGLHALEVGCGLGLPGIAALQAGMRVTFSDYDATALKFAAESARLNGLTDFRLLLLDWRSPPPELYDVIIASDVTYEERSVAPLVELFDKVLAPGGLVLLADQNRPYRDLLERRLGAHGFTWLAKAFDSRPDEGVEVSGTVFWIRRV